MSEPKSVFDQYEDRVENALWSYEVKGQLEEALNEYHAVETDLDALSISPDHPSYSESLHTACCAKVTSSVRWDRLLKHRIWVSGR